MTYIYVLPKLSRYYLFFCHIDWTATMPAALKMLSCHIHKDRYITPCHLISNVTYL